MKSQRPSGMLAAAAVATACLSLTFPAPAPAGAIPLDGRHDPAESRPPQTPGGISAVRRVATAHALAVIGRDERNPRAMIMAAELLIMAGIDLPGTLADTQDELVPAPGASAASKGSVFAPFSAQALLDEASALSDGDPKILTEIRQLQARGDGSKLGHLPEKRYAAFSGGARVVPGRTTWHHMIEVKADMPIRIAALGDGQAAIGLEVRDADGSLVCRDAQPDVTLVCGTIPLKAGKFVVQIRNWSEVSTQVLLIANTQRHER